MQSLAEKGHIKKHWTVRKFNPLPGLSSEDVARRFFASNDPRFAPHEVIEFDENVLLNEGITEFLNLIGGIAATAFDNANAYLGVGDGAAFTALTGTSAFTNGSAAVVGTGTTYTTEVSAGDFIKLDADDVMAEVQSVTDNTNIVLVDNYAGAGGTAAASSVMAAPVATETGLQGASEAYVGMEATYPQVAGQTITWRSLFGSAVANFHWREGTVANGNSGASVNANRKLKELGVKASGATWTLDLNIQLS